MAEQLSGEHPAQARVHILGPVFAPDLVGGYQLALKDLARELRALGWLVDLHTESAPASGADTTGLLSTRSRSGLARISQGGALFMLWRRLPLALRRFVSTCFKPKRYFVTASQNLHAVEALLARLADDDRVIFFVDDSAPGMASLVAERCPQVLMCSLGGLAAELRARWWHGIRALCNLRFGNTLHPGLYRPLRPADVRRAVFCSRQWRDEAVAAGLPAECAHTIYFGIPTTATPVRERPFAAQLLWVGRLVPEKGLHLLLRALPEVRRAVPGVTLTAVAAPGQPEYRLFLERLIEREGMTDIVKVIAPVSRAELPQLYASHDALFFYSRYEDPVALVLMEAYAAGLPVIASIASSESALVQPDSTCVCYEPRDTASIVDATVRLLSDARLRDANTSRARSLLTDSFSCAAMGRAYDKLLRTGTIDDAASGETDDAATA